MDLTCDKWRIFRYAVCAFLMVFLSQNVLLQGTTLRISPTFFDISKLRLGVNAVANITTKLLHTQKLRGTGPVCQDFSIWGEHKSLKPVVSNMDVWSFAETVQCPYLNISEIKLPVSRTKVRLICSESNQSFLHQEKTTNVTQDMHMVPFGESCVSDYLQNCCHGNKRVPNVVHYVWYNRDKLTFVTFLSMLSVLRFVKPCLIIFHGDRLPGGHYWDFILHIYPSVVHMKREPPATIYGKQVIHKEHSSDIMRIEALILYGGIYLDTDTVIVKSIENLRNYPCVLSKQSSGLIGNAFIMAERNSTFMGLWRDSYRDKYEPKKYIFNSMSYTGKLAKDHPTTIHIEYTTVSRPDGMIGGKVYNSAYATYNWSYIYGIHLYSRIYKKPFNEVAIRKLNFTVGSISRHVVYGNKEICNE